MKKLKKRIKKLEKAIADNKDSMRNFDFELQSFKESAIVEFAKYAGIIKELREYNNENIKKESENK